MYLYNFCVFIKVVDGVNGNDSLEVDLHIDKVYKWLAMTQQERQNFISGIYAYSCGLAQRPEFKNVPKEWLVDPTLLKESDSVTLIPGEYQKVEYSLSVKLIVIMSNFFLTEMLNQLAPTITSDYQAITEKEASDLSSLISGCDYAISNAELFMEVISKDLSVLDGENVQSVLASEPQVTQLMKGIEAAICEASIVEARLIAYDEALGRIREAMARVGQKNQAIHTANHNARLLLEQLDFVIVTTHLLFCFRKIDKNVGFLNYANNCF